MKRNTQVEINKWQKNMHSVALFEDEYYRYQYSDQFWSLMFFFLPISIKTILQ
jgi:hypothetical protein